MEETVSRENRPSRSRSRSVDNKPGGRKDRKSSASSSRSSSPSSRNSRKSRESSIEERRRVRRENRRHSRSSSRERFIRNREKSRQWLQNSHLPRRPWRRGQYMRSPQRNMGHRFNRQRYNNYSPRKWSPRRRFGSQRDRDDRGRDDHERDGRDFRREREYDSRSRSRSQSRSRSHSRSHSREHDKDKERSIYSRPLQEDAIKMTEPIKDGRTPEPQLPAKSAPAELPLEYQDLIIQNAPPLKSEPNARVFSNNLNTEILKEVEQLAAPIGDLRDVLSIIDSAAPTLNLLTKHPEESIASDNDSSSDESSSSERRKRKRKSKSRKKPKKDKKKKRKKDKRHDEKKIKKGITEELKSKVKCSGNDADELLKLITGPNEIKAPSHLTAAKNDLEHFRRMPEVLPPRPEVYAWSSGADNLAPNRSFEAKYVDYGESSGHRRSYRF